MAGVRSDVGSCITGQLLGHAPRFNAIGALGILRGLSADLLKEIENTGNSISGLAKERNRIVHDALYFELSTGQTAQFRSVLPKNKIFGIEDINNESVQEIVSKIVNKRASVSRIRANIKDTLSSSR